MSVRKLFITFAGQTAQQSPGPGFVWRDVNITKESVYPRWFLTVGNSRKIHIKVKDVATVDARGM